MGYIYIYGFYIYIYKGIVTSWFGDVWGVYFILGHFYPYPMRFQVPKYKVSTQTHNHDS